MMITNNALEKSTDEEKKQGAPSSLFFQYLVSLVRKEIIYFDVQKKSTDLYIYTVISQNSCASLQLILKTRERKRERVRWVIIVVHFCFFSC